MGDHDDRVSVPVHYLAQQREHAAPGLGVQRPGRLVGEHHLRPGDERPGDRDPLLLASGELGRTVAQAFLQTDPRGDFAHLRAPRAATVQPQRQTDVLGDRQRRHQVEGLEDEPDPLSPQDRQPPLTEPRQVNVTERDGAGGRPVKPSGNMKERALARPRGPHDRGERPPGEPDGDPVQGDDRGVTLAVDLADVAKRDCGSRCDGSRDVESGVRHVVPRCRIGIAGSTVRRAPGGALLPVLCRSARWRRARAARGATAWEQEPPASLAGATRATSAGTSSSRRGASSSRAATRRG